MPAVRFKKRFYVNGRMFGPGVEQDVPAELIEKLPSTAEVLEKDEAKKEAAEAKKREAASKDQEIALSQMGKSKSNEKGFAAAMKKAAAQK